MALKPVGTAGGAAVDVDDDPEADDDPDGDDDGEGAADGDGAGTDPGLVGVVDPPPDEHAAMTNTSTAMTNTSTAMTNGSDRAPAR